MVNPGNQHCANCIGTLSFPIPPSRRSGSHWDPETLAKLTQTRMVIESTFFSLISYWPVRYYRELVAVAYSLHASKWILMQRRN